MDPEVNDRTNGLTYLLYIIIGAFTLKSPFLFHISPPLSQFTPFQLRTLYLPSIVMPFVLFESSFMHLKIFFSIHPRY